MPSSCSPHPQVISPCADDTLPVEDVLSVSGDISFDEEGSVALSEDQNQVEVTFGFQKETAAYVFEYLYVKSTEGTFIGAVSKEQTTKKFVARFTGGPVDLSCTLFWRVKVPDGLHSCPSLQNSPKYAILPASRQGEAQWPVGQSFVDIVFEEAMPSSDWGFDQRDIEHPIITVPQVFSEPTITLKTVNGCRLQYSSFPTEEDYFVRWKTSDRSLLE